MAALIGMPRAAWKRQPRGAVDLRYEYRNSRCFLRGHSVTGGEPLRPGANIVDTPMGIGTLLSFASALTFSILPTYDSGGNDWTVLMVVKNTDTGIYPYILGLSGFAVPFALSLNHGNYPGNAVWYDGATVGDLGTGIQTRETATVALRHIKSINAYSWFKNGKSMNTTTQTSLNGIWQFAAAGSGTGPDTAVFPLLYFTQRGLSNNELLDLTTNPWQLFKPRLARFILIPSSGGATTYTATLSLDSLIQKTLTQSASLDALLRSTFSSTISVDALVAAVQTGTLSLDALLQLTKTSTVSIDALLRAAKTGTVSVDALLQVTLSSEVSVDALIQSAKTGTLSLDAALQKNLSAITSLDALIQAAKTGTVSLDAILTGATGTALSTSLDALIQAIKTGTLSLDAMLQKAYTSTLALDAYVALVGTKTVSLDAMIQAVKTGTLSLDALIQMTKTTFVSFDALIQAAKTGTLSLDAILVFATQANVFLDALVQKALFKGVSLDAIIGAIADIVMPTGRVIFIDPSERLITILPSDRLII